MRLWHNELISVLPRNQLLGQWRELNSIYKLKNRHILINFVYEYPKTHLYTYSSWIIKEMKRRNYRINLDNYNLYFDKELDKSEIDPLLVFSHKMTKRYLLQCYYNLQEKYDCGGITDDEWISIDNCYKLYLEKDLH